MAALVPSASLRLQCVRMPARPGGKVILEGVSRDMMLQGLQLLLQEKLGVPVARQLLLQSGVPPRRIETRDAHMSLAALGIQSGYRIEVHEMDQEQMDAEASAAAAAAAMVDTCNEEQPGAASSSVPVLPPQPPPPPPSHVMVQGVGGWKYPSSINVQRGSFVCVPMPGDNSCMIHSVGYVCEADITQRTPTKAKARKLRELIANIVASSPRLFTTAFLGMPNEAYQARVLNPNSWGGFIELSIFSRHFGVEIVSFDPRYLREDVYGSHDGGGGGAADEGHTRRVFVLYVDGTHYDALAWQPSAMGGSGSASQQTIFSVKDENAWVRAREFCLGLHQELVREGKCDLQTQWRTNNHLKKTTAQDHERMRQERIQVDASRVQVVRDATQALEQQQQQQPQQETNDTGTLSATVAAATEWTCPTCTVVNTTPMGTACSVCTWSAAAARVHPKPSTPAGFTCLTCTAWNNTPHASRCAVCLCQRDGSSGVSEHKESRDDANDGFGYGDGNEDNHVRAPLPQVQEQLLGGPPSGRGDEWEWDASSPVVSKAAVARKPRKVLPRWACMHCTTSNIGSARKCAACQMRRATL
jgi:ubiquitin thioesterase OTU1